MTMITTTTATALSECPPELCLADTEHPSFPHRTELFQRIQSMSADEESWRWPETKARRGSGTELRWQDGKAATIKTPKCIAVILVVQVCSVGTKISYSKNNGNKKEQVEWSSCQCYHSVAPVISLTFGGYGSIF